MLANSGSYNSIAEMFLPVTIHSRSGAVYTGKRPGEITDSGNSFSFVTITSSVGDVIVPTHPPASETVIGYDVAINVTADMFTQQSSYRWKITSLLSSNRRWCTYVDLNFNIHGEFE